MQPAAAYDDQNSNHLSRASDNIQSGQFVPLSGMAIMMKLPAPVGSFRKLEYPSIPINILRLT